MRYAVRYTNVDVLASVVATGRPWRRPRRRRVFLLALATLCVAVARPHVTRLVASDKATVVLVLDVSGSMQAIDVKPTRLAAAQKALHTFLDKVPARLQGRPRPVRRRGRGRDAADAPTTSSSARRSTTPS